MIRLAVTVMLAFAILDVLMAIMFLSQGQVVMGLLVLVASYCACYSAASGLEYLREKD